MIFILMIGLLIILTSTTIYYKSQYNEMKVSNVILLETVDWYIITNKSLQMDKAILLEPHVLSETIEEMRKGTEVVTEYGELLLEKIENLDGLYEAVESAENDITKLYRISDHLINKED